MAAAFTQTQPRTQTAAERLSLNFADINRKVLAMAKDFPEDKYNFRLKPEMRSFGEVIVHIASGNVFAAKAGRGEKVKWDELDAKKLPYEGGDSRLDGENHRGFHGNAEAESGRMNKSLEPFLSVTEHSAEHYGLLVAYYRANGMVPPESRPKPKMTAIVFLAAAAAGCFRS